ncbi:unnamed protein product [Trifolium pratense]|uniref:Uncharacterized protein n=1 Tax=Trifolium pratense TaxID=57577 RepID=A0ACB0K8J3_TRIPR|nr:unnamed protein product [Trifolium pratense]
MIIVLAIGIEELPPQDVVDASKKVKDLINIAITGMTEVKSMVKCRFLAPQGD